jgi:3-oxoacyl-(acyl-carrier-protein) synthase/malonyl CoA-acyl carrier protein transacylase/phosphopantetheinyl transferase (holo-ACP synthase)
VTAANKDIAIVGISLLCPAGDCVEEFWHSIATGGDFITEIPDNIIESFYFDKDSSAADRFYCNKGGVSKPCWVDPLRYGLLPVTVKGLDPEQLISLSLVERALIDAGVYEKDLPLNKGSMIIGRGSFPGVVTLRCNEIVRSSNQLVLLLKEALPSLSDEDLNQFRKVYQSRQGMFQSDTAIGTMPNLIASLVANRFDMQGPAYLLDAACASGIVAIDHSITLLRSGQCDIAVAGGMHAGHSSMFMSAFNMMGAMTHKGQITPFAKNADGLIVGVGEAFIVLKTLEKAERDGDRIYAVIKDTAVCSDGGGSHVTVTSVPGEVRVMDLAWKKAGMDPAKIGYVEAHGTGTPVGDRVEITALKEFFGDSSTPRAWVGSLKSNVGHMMGAAGIMGVIKAALALYYRTIPPTLHCEEPLPVMFESRFLPPSEAIPWDEDQYPLVAAVNAFGFGGINSHAILTAYKPSAGAPPQPLPRPWLGETIMLSAPDKEALVAKVKAGDFTDTGGSWRIALFDPTEKRLALALSIIDKGVPWRGRSDIWFSNEQLLTEGGKTVFMFPGFFPEEAPDTDDLTGCLGLPMRDQVVDELVALIKDPSSVKREGIRNMETVCAQDLMLRAFDKLGIKADLYIGHSIGEWMANTFAGNGTSEDFSEIIKLVGDSQTEHTHPFIAVSVDLDTALTWCAQIPGLYVSNDNCPGQILMCGEKAAHDTLLELLERERVFYTVLPFGSGMHTPLWNDRLDKSMASLDLFENVQGSVPVWSATTLEPIPTNSEEYRTLVRRQLVEPVYFRELTEKLYHEQGARLFVQIGSGNLVGFVENTLKGLPFGAVSTVSPGRSALAQMRRVMALLFVEGQPVDLGFSGVKIAYHTSHSVIELPLSAPLFTNLPELGELLKKGGVSSMPQLDASGIDDPIALMAHDNVQCALETQNELLQLFASRAPARGERRRPARALGRLGAGTAAPGETPGAPSGTPGLAAPASGLAPGTASTGSPTASPHGAAFEETLRLTFEDHPYLIDHAFVHQPDDWPWTEDLSLVVPFTMSIELLVDRAMQEAPGRKLVKVSRITAYKWITVEEGFEAPLRGTWRSADVLEVELVGFFKVDACFADEYPQPPADYLDSFDPGPEALEPLTAKEYYERYAFHGPMYQSNTFALKVCERGFVNLAEKKEGKGSLLDVMGQQLGLHLHLHETENIVSFPVRLKELNFYSDYTDQTGEFQHTLVITKLTPTYISGDMLLSRDGKPWCIARNFVCQRFAANYQFWNTLHDAINYRLANEIAPGVFHYTNTSSNNANILAERLYLGTAKRRELHAIKDLREHCSRFYGLVALKDAARSVFAPEGGPMLAPIEFECHHDENGKPFLYRRQNNQMTPIAGVNISLSHSGEEAAAVISNCPVGVDLERIEEKSPGFHDTAFVASERALLDGFSPDARVKAAIAFWVAKEAVAKKRGITADSVPQDYLVTKIEGDTVWVGDDAVHTEEVSDGYLMGWTLPVDVPGSEGNDHR